MALSFPLSPSIPFHFISPPKFQTKYRHPHPLQQKFLKHFVNLQLRRSHSTTSAVKMSTPSPPLLLPLLNPKLKRAPQTLAPNPNPRQFLCRNAMPPSPPPPESPAAVDCVGTGTDVECFVGETDGLIPDAAKAEALELEEESTAGFVRKAVDWAVLISPFFFWGTAMVAMKGVIPKTGPFFVSAFRLVPAGLILVAFAAARGRKMPAGLMAWVSIALFGIVDAACFQGFLAEGLLRTSAGLGSVIIDSQPLTVAVLAYFLFGESIGAIGAAGLLVGVVGLLLLEVPALSIEENSSSIWGSGEWWMLLAAQSMAIGTVMVRWVSKYSDPIMATGWHMVIGGVPLLIISIINHDPAMSGSLSELTSGDIVALCYTSLFGSAISYGVYFYNATRGSLTKLSSLTFLTPMFASIFGYLYLGETFSPLQLVGAFVTIIAIYMVNYREITKGK